MSNMFFYNWRGRKEYSVKFPTRIDVYFSSNFMGQSKLHDLSWYWEAKKYNFWLKRNKWVKTPHIKYVKRIQCLIDLTNLICFLKNIYWDIIDRQQNAHIYIVQLDKLWNMYKTSKAISTVKGEHIHHPPDIPSPSYKVIHASTHHPSCYNPGTTGLLLFYFIFCIF